ncbi:hypothetical protein GALL_243270 [mine drainage metagenome]|uniref:Uncharacterized protein n=1 Tax=mine drainage metagenome TaxID=410659 RepID=A0A1J5RP52_9ZZZZ
MPIDQRQHRTHPTTYFRPSWRVLAALALIIIAAPALAGESGLIPTGSNVKCDGVTTQCVIYDGKGQRVGTVDQDGGAGRWVVRDTKGQRTGTIDVPEDDQRSGRQEDEAGQER